MRVELFESQAILMILKGAARRSLDFEVEGNTNFSLFAKVVIYTKRIMIPPRKINIRASKIQKWVS